MLFFICLSPSSCISLNLLRCECTANAQPGRGALAPNESKICAASTQTSSIRPISSYVGAAHQMVNSLRNGKKNMLFRLFRAFFCRHAHDFPCRYARFWIFAMCSSQKFVENRRVVNKIHDISGNLECISWKLRFESIIMNIIHAVQTRRESHPRVTNIAMLLIGGSSASVEKNSSRL